MTELQARNERKAEMAALTRDELIGVLTDVVHATRARLSEARTADGLKAAEMLTKMCGWNEPEKGEVRHIHLQVDAGLIEQLRTGYAEMSATRVAVPTPCTGGLVTCSRCGARSRSSSRRMAAPPRMLEHAHQSSPAYFFAACSSRPFKTVIPTDWPFSLA
jgi:hypothetical protein